MNEFKELCERLLEMPAPALPTSAQMLAEARRSARRRHRLRLLFSALALSAVALVVSQAGQPARPPTPVLEVRWAHMPEPEAVASHKQQAADAVIRAVPKPSLSPSWYALAQDGRILSLRMTFHTGDAEGVLTVLIDFAESPVATDDLCAVEIGAGRWGALDLCYELPVGDQQIRVAVGPKMIVATRFLRDGSVTVLARNEESGPGLIPRQVAEIAADPDILPQPVRGLSR